MANKTLWFCGLCSLGRGTIIIGVVCMIINLLEIGTAAVILNPHWNLGEFKIWGQPVTETQLILLLVIAISQSICNIYLIYGAKEEKVYMVLPWLIVESIMTIVATIICFVAIGQADINFSLGFIFYVLLNVYFLLVVYKLYKILREKAKVVNCTESEEIQNKINDELVSL